MSIPKQHWHVKEAGGTPFPYCLRLNCEARGCKGKAVYSQDQTGEATRDHLPNGTSLVLSITHTKKQRFFLSSFPLLKPVAL